MPGPTEPGPGPDEPTRAWQPGDLDADAPPTQAVPAAGVGSPPPPPRPPAPPPGVPPPDRRWLAAVGAVAALLVVALIVLLASRGHSHHSSAATTTLAPATTAPSLTTSAPSTTVLPTSVVNTLPPLPSTSTPTSAAPTAPGNRPPTAAESQTIQAQAAPPDPNATIDLIRIANSDASWAVVHIGPKPGHESDVQPSYEVLHDGASGWQEIAGGTTQVDCGGGVPPSIQADFASVLGTC